MSDSRRTACLACLLRSALRTEVLAKTGENAGGSKAMAVLLAMPDEQLVYTIAERASDVASSVDAFVCQVLPRVLQAANTAAICRHHEHYPAGLGELSDAPAVIYLCGEVGRFAELCSNPSVAVVGSRRPSRTGQTVASEIGRDLSAASVTVVSGMALGIDGAAHRGACETDCRSIAVLAGGPETAYPATHRSLHADLVKRGAVLSELPPGVRPRRWGFPARNRLIAALCGTTIVVEGAKDSGSLHTADFAAQLGRVVAAVPSDVCSALGEAPNGLLYDGASLVRDSQDALDLALGVGQSRVIDSSVPPDELVSVWNVVGTTAGTADEILRATPDLEAGELVQALSKLELAGFVSRDMSGRYLRSDRGFR